MNSLLLKTANSRERNFVQDGSVVIPGFELLFLCRKTGRTQTPNGK